MLEDSSQDEQDFDAAFAEQTAQRNPEAASPAAPSPKQASQTPPEQSAAAQPVASDKPLDAPSDKVAATPVGETPEAKASPDDLLAQALHRERSSANRISAFAKENNQLKASNVELLREVARLKSAPTRPAPAASTGRPDVLKDAPDLEAAVKVRIEQEMKPMRDALEAANQRLSEVDGAARNAAERLQPLTEAEERRQLTGVMTQLDGEFSPEWRRDIKTPEFAAWLGAQDEVVQGRYENATTFAASSTVLRMYFADKGLQRKATASTAETPQPTKPVANDRLRQAAGIAPRSAASVSTKPEDFDGAFEEFAAANRAKQRIQVTSNVQHLR